MRIFQVIENIVFGDAISNHAINIYKILKKNGYETAIYAVNHDTRLDETMVRSMKEMPELKENDLIIYQMCQSSSINTMIKSWKCKKACIYHNVTPPEFFLPYDSFQSRFQQKGLKEIGKLKETFDYVWGVSRFNCDNLIEMGYDREKISVSPILLDFSDFRQEPDQKTVNRYSDNWVNILFVGRIAPNKKQEDIIRAFAYYKKYVNKKSRLILVGSFFNSSYQHCLEKYIEQLEVEDVIFPGHITFKEILGFYSVANVLLCMSEHEGFCVPLLEAMLFDVPIIAYGAAAIPETLAGSGILLKDKDPAKVSYAIEQLVSNEDLRRKVIEKQRQRLDDFDLEKLGNVFLEQIKRITEL